MKRFRAEDEQRHGSPLGDCGRHAAARALAYCEDRGGPVAGQEQLFRRSVAARRVVDNEDAAPVQHKQLRDVFRKRDADDTATVLPELLQSRKARFSLWPRAGEIACTIVDCSRSKMRTHELSNPAAMCRPSAVAAVDRMESSGQRNS